MITYAVDFESYYDKECSVSVYGPRGYFAHPKFDAYMVSVVADDGYEWCGDPAKFDWSKLAGQRVLSHNASFDESLYLYGIEQGWWASADYAEWHCTADLAAFLGKPRALKNAVKDIFKVELSKETRDNMKGLDWDLMDPEFKAEVTAYALDDSRWCLKLWQELESQWPEYERYYSAHTRKICRRGLPVDEELISQNAAKLRISLFEAHEAIPWKDSGALLSRTEANKACRAAGIAPPKSWAMGDEECEAWLDLHAETFPWVYAVRSYRRINALLKKVEAFEKGSIDNRYYGGLMYCGAHTKRFSGSGGNLNLQNLPRKEMFGVDLRSQIRSPEGSSLVVVDLSQIEVRTLCWLAKDWDTLNEIRNTEDMYEAFAIRFGLWSKDKGSMKSLDPGLRLLVKGMVLGCGYGASAKKYAMIMKCDLDEATKSVRLYQTKMNKVVELWRKFEREIKMASKSGEYRVELPSGNAMHYKGVNKTADALVCTMVRNGRPMLVRPWHGMLTENCLIGETDVLSKQRGWVQIQDVSLDDELWDGLNFVKHKGLINSGIQEVIECHGITCTPDHQFLIEDSWVSAEKARHLELSLVRLPHGVNKQSKRLYWKKIWDLLSGKANRKAQTKYYLGTKMRLWKNSESFIRRAHNWKVLLKKLSTARIENFGPKVYAQEKQTQTFCGVAINERPVSFTKPSGLGELRRSWNYSMSRMAIFISGILGSNVPVMVGRTLPRSHRQQQGLLFRKLSMVNPSGKYAEYSTLTNSRLGLRSIRQKWNCAIDAFIQNKCWGILRNSEHLETKLFKQVFDIRDCGPKNRFVVRGSQDQLLIAHNCSQSLARDVFCYHLRQIEEAGHKIILHVHDEVVIECLDRDAERTLADVTQIMRTPPPWIPDIPLDAEGHVVKIYTK
jgi:DNA polymerase I-like protein with 3'-5' exonuclease and polymerase domains